MYISYYAHSDLSLSLHRADDVYGPITAFLQNQYGPEDPYFFWSWNQFIYRTIVLLVVSYRRCIYISRAVARSLMASSNRTISPSSNYIAIVVVYSSMGVSFSCCQYSNHVDIATILWVLYVETWSEVLCTNWRVYPFRACEQITCWLLSRTFMKTTKFSSIYLDEY